MKPAHLTRSTAFFAGVHCLTVVVQPVLAGMILGGSDFDALDAHKWIGRFAFVACMLLAITCGVEWRWRGASPAWAILAVMLMAAEALQIYLGFKADLLWHIPLGVAIVAGACVLAYAIVRSMSDGSQPVAQRA